MTGMPDLIPRFVHEQLQNGRRAGVLNAAVLTCDVSGFMPLTEALLRQGDGAAGLLAEGLDDLFAPLVAEVHARGAFVAAFAGDGFTAVFPHDPVATPGAPLQAALAATSIQDAFVSCGGSPFFRHSGGALPLCLKVGLSYGEVRWRVPGHGGRFTFCFRGEAVAGASRAEQQAGAGGIIADRPILPWIESRCQTRSVGRGHEGYVQLLSCPDRPLPTDRPSPGLDRAAQAPFVAASLLDEPPAAAFRHLCPAFVSFDEGMEDGPLDRLLAAALRHARQYGGLLGDVTIGPAGGLLPVWFGLPSGQPGDAERAAGFLQALVSDGLGPIGGGLTAGRAWTGFLGGTARAAYTAIGDVVNLAARLAAQAGRGQVWASQAVFDSLSGSHGFVTRGAQYVKGKVSPVPIYELCA